jgi:hypothetical protein
MISRIRTLLRDQIREIERIQRDRHAAGEGAAATNGNNKPARSSAEDIGQSDPRLSLETEGIK